MIRKSIKNFYSAYFINFNIRSNKRCEKAVSIDSKFEGDLVYVLGTTHDELGGSEYFAMKGEQERGKKYIGNNCSKSWCKSKS